MRGTFLPLIVILSSEFRLADFSHQLAYYLLYFFHIIKLIVDRRPRYYRMADDKKMTPESPENWDEYSRLLRGLPARTVPAGFEQRLDARMKAASGGGARRRFIWRAIVPAFSIASILMVIVLSSLPDTPQVIRRVETTSAPAAPRKIRNHSPRPTPRVNRDPVVSSSTASTPLDTSVPQSIGTTEPATPNIDHRTQTPHGEEPIVTGRR